jgi:hypothetical protein
MKSRMRILITLITIALLVILVKQISNATINLSNYFGEINTDADLTYMAYNYTYAFLDAKPSELYNGKLGLGDNTINRWNTAVCLGHVTGNGSRPEKDVAYYVKNIIDVDLEENSIGKVTVYGANSPDGVTFYNDTWAARMAYLSYYAKKYSKTTWNETDYKQALMRTILHGMMHGQIKDYIDPTVLTQNDSTDTADITDDSVIIAGDFQQQRIYMQNSLKYANSGLGLSLSAIDTDPSLEQKDGKTYMGPYKISYSGAKIDSITVKAGGTTYNAKWATKSGSTYNIYDFSGSASITSGGEFYVVVDGNIEISTINSIQVKTEEKTIYSARICCLSNVVHDTQILGVYGGEEHHKSLTVDLKIPTAKDTSWKVVLYKSDITNKAGTASGISGAKYRVTLNGTTLGDYTTKLSYDKVHTNATIIHSIKPGETQTLKIVEIEAPKGYVVTSEPVIITIKCDENMKVTMSCKSNLQHSNNDNDSGEYRFNPQEGVSYVKFFNRPEGKYKIQIVKQDEDTGAKLSGAKFNLNGTAIGTTDANGILTSGNIVIKSEGTDTLTITETSAPYDYQDLGNIKIDVTKAIVNNKYAITGVSITENPNNCSATISGDTIILTVPNKRIIHNGEYKVKIVKQDNKDGRKLSGAKFSLNGTEIGSTDTNGILVSPEIVTSSTGTDNLTISEIQAPDYYEAVGDIKLQVTKEVVNYKYTATKVSISQNANGSSAVLEGDTIILTIPNKRKTITIDGYVWEDEKGGKESTVNGTKDSSENPVEGMEVNLHTDGNSIYSDDPSTWTTTTDKNGHYEFEVPEGVSYYVEFKYNGYNYQHTKYTKYTGASSPITSNATETEKKRDEFNNRLAEITPTTSINNVKVSNKDNELKATELGNNEIYAISAYVGGHGEEGTTKFSETAHNINLGITKREIVDLALRKDVYSAKLSIKGKTQTYMYNRNDKETDGNGNSYWDIKVRQSDSEYYSNYSRQVQEADYNYSGNNKLEAEVTYKITVRNQSGVVNSGVTELVDFYDKDYTLASAKTASGENIAYSTESSYTHNISIADYQKVYLKVNKKLTPGEDLVIYVTFKVNSDNSGKLQLDNDSGKGNMVEIMGYTTVYGDKAKSPNDGNTEDTYTEYKTGDVVGRIDEDSNPGNATSLDEKTFEDDTDRAPYMKFEIDTSKRTASGVVWEDGRDQEVAKAEVGDGIRNEDSPVKGITVQLVNLEDGSVAQIWNNGWKEATTTTDDSGSYSLSGFVPGNYYVQFIYPDGQKYKSTTFNYTEVCPDFNVNNPDNLGTYKETSTNYSDARDIWGSTSMEQSREYVNSLLGDQTSGTLDDYTGKNISMKAVTGQIEVYIEKGGNDIQGLSGRESLEYKLENIDFGLQERPKAQLMLTKKVDNLKVTLANGNTLFDASGKATNVLWQDKTPHSYGYTNNKMNKPEVRANAQSIQLTMDEELMHGATIKIQYGITVQNIGEVDYASKLFYYRARIENNETPVTTTVNKIVDYPGAAGGTGSADENSTRGNLQYNSAENSGWEVKNASDLTNEKLVKYITDSNDVTSTVLNKYKTILIHNYTDDEGTLLPAIYDEAKSKTGDVKLTLSQVMTTESTSDELAYKNIAEIVQLKNGVARKMEYSTPGNQNPDEEIQEVDADVAQSVTILPPFGETYIYYALAGAVAIILIAGIVLIKVKVLKPKQ